MAGLKNLKEKYLKDINFDKAKDRLDKFVVQAKDSIKVLESLQKEGLNMAKHYVQTNDIAGKTKKFTKDFTDEKIKKNLHKLGIATFEEVKELEKKLEGVTTEFKKHLSKIKKKD